MHYVHNYSIIYYICNRKAGSVACHTIRTKDMANISKPKSDNLSDLSKVTVPVSYSTLTGLSYLLSNIIVSGKNAMPYVRTIATSSFTSGNYNFPTPNGYVAAPYQLPILEPQTWNVVADIISAYQPVELYQIGNKSYVNDQGITIPADLMQNTFPINIYPGTYPSDAGTIKPLGLNQSVIIRVYKNAGVAINWQSSNILNSGLTDAAIQSASELSFVVTNILGKYQVTDWISPDFVETQLSTLKTVNKSNLAGVVNELFDKIPPSVALPKYDTHTLRLAKDILSVIWSPGADKANLLGSPMAVSDFSKIKYTPEFMSMEAGEIMAYTTYLDETIIDGPSFTPSSGFITKTISDGDVKMYVLAMGAETETDIPKIAIGCDFNILSWFELDKEPTKLCSNVVITDFTDLMSLFDGAPTGTLITWNAPKTVPNGPWMGTPSYGYAQFGQHFETGTSVVYVTAFSGAPGMWGEGEDKLSPRTATASMLPPSAGWGLEPHWVYTPEEYLWTNFNPAKDIGNIDGDATLEIPLTISPPTTVGYISFPIILHLHTILQQGADSVNVMMSERDRIQLDLLVGSTATYSFMIYSLNVDSVISFYIVTFEFGLTNNNGKMQLNVTNVGGNQPGQNILLLDAVQIPRSSW